MADPTYIDNSGQALIALVGVLAPIAEASAEIIVEEIKAAIDQSSPAGREYQAKKGSKAKRRASAPEQAPAGEPYRNSWHPTSASRKGDRISALAFSKAKTRNGESLAAALEFGTPRMAPRPHIRPALERARARIDHLTKQASAV